MDASASGYSSMRLEPPTIGGSGGLGIGLALVRSLVALHGGTIEASSDGPGRGSVFAVDLPIGDLAEPRPRPSAPRRPRLAYPLRVLIVDDVRDAADSLALLLAPVDLRALQELLCRYSDPHGE